MRILTLEAIPQFCLVSIQEREIDSKNTLKEFYKYLRCDLIDIVEVEIDEHYYDIICDEEFLFKSPKIPTVYVNEDLIIFNSCAFARCDRNGNTLGLTDNDVKRIKRWLLAQDIKMRQWLHSIQR